MSFFFLKYSKFFFFLYGIRGLRLVVSGKISATGSAKKKTFLLRAGSHGTTTKSLKVSYFNDFI